MDLRFIYFFFCIVWVKSGLSSKKWCSDWVEPVGPGCRQGFPRGRMTFDPLVAWVCTLWPQQLRVLSHCEGWRPGTPRLQTQILTYIHTHTHTLEHKHIQNTHRDPALHYWVSKSKLLLCYFVLIIKFDFDGFSVNIIKFPQSHKVWHSFIN